MYYLDIKPSFWKVYKKLTQSDSKLQKKTVKTLRLLKENPSHPSLNTHRVDTRQYGIRWSSWITSDLRVIWDFDTNNQLVILILTMGGHSGKGKVYK